MSTQLSDQELILSYLDGNHECFEELFERHRHKVYAYLVKLVQNTDVAGDLFQDTFIKVIHLLKSRQYDEQGKFINWVMRMAHNLAIDHLRKASKFRVCENDYDDGFDCFNRYHANNNNAESAIITEEILGDVRKLIEQLPASQREIVYLRHYKKMTFAKIAEQNNISINTALARMRYALKRMRKMIEEKNLVMVQ
jgi:RNA polymerase sigma-70 factor (ECF subfamily)